MKKAYVQPDIIFDSFSLSENVATANANCTRNITNQYSGDCGLQYGNKVVFVQGAGGCHFKVVDGSPMFNGLCYHIPTGDRRLFNS